MTRDLGLHVLIRQTALFNCLLSQASATKDIIQILLEPFPRIKRAIFKILCLFQDCNI